MFTVTQIRIRMLSTGTYRKRSAAQIFSFLLISLSEMDPGATFKLDFKNQLLTSNFVRFAFLDCDKIALSDYWYWYPVSVLPIIELLDQHFAHNCPLLEIFPA